jgi:hypothetical protein
VTDDQEKAAYFKKRRQELRAAFERWARQMESTGVNLKCPICGSKHWTLHLTETATPFDETLTSEGPWDPAIDRLLRGPVVPRLPVVCGTCSFIAEFAWLQIKRQADPEKL